MTPDETTFLRDFYRAIEDRALKPDDQFYVPLYKNPSLTALDPVDLLARGIEWGGADTAQLFSGFRGTGKTTELYRLRKKLESSGYTVVMFDFDDYLASSMPVDVSDFLIFLAGALSDAARGLLPKGHESYWDRFMRFVQGVTAEGLEVTAGLDVGVAAATIKTNLKRDPNFRRFVQERLAMHLGSLVDDVREYVADVVKSVRAGRDASQGVVLLVDGVEQIRGVAGNAELVQRSVEVLFAGHAEKLRLPSVHVVYTVPPYLKILYGGLGGLYSGGGVRFLYALAVQERGREGPRPPGVDALEQVIARRGDWLRLLGDRSVMERIILKSGGHLRDLLSLLRQVILLAERLPVAPETVDQAIGQLTMEMLPIPEDDAVWLKAIADTGDPGLRSLDRLPRLSTFLDAHQVLCYRNHGEWYDVHPLIRSEVMDLAQRVAMRSITTSAQGDAVEG